MNAFYKVKASFWSENNKNTEYCGVAIGNDEGDIMNKVMSYYGRDNVEQVSFWFGENYSEDVIEIEDFKDCPLFDFHQKF